MIFVHDWAPAKISLGFPLRALLIPRTACWLSWIARGVARIAADPPGALADFDQALLLNPRSPQALQDKAHVFSERLQRPANACMIRASVC